MRRRDFITLVGSAAAMPLVARAQEKSKRIARSRTGRQLGISSELAGGLRRGLRDLGDREPTFIEGKVMRGDAASVRARVEEAIRQHAAVLFVIGSELAKIARQVSSELPIVFVTPGDPESRRRHCYPASRDQAATPRP